MLYHLNYIERNGLPRSDLYNKNEYYSHLEQLKKHLIKQ